MSNLSGVANEVYSLIEELSTLSRLDKLRGAQLGRAYELMGLLRDSGFTPGEISRFTWNPVSGKLKWGKAAVRKCGKWSGVADMSRRDSVVDFISGLVESGVRLEEVAEFKVAKPKLDRVGLSFSDSAKIARARVDGRIVFTPEMVAKITNENMRDALDHLRSRSDYPPEILVMDNAGAKKSIRIREKAILIIHGHSIHDTTNNNF